MNIAAIKRTVRETFVDNPMHAEATRTLRRLQRTGAESGKVANGVTIGLIGLCYLWLLASILRYGDDVTYPLLGIELFLVTLFLPLSIYGAISGEREKQTWEALILTRLTPGQIIAGKLIWRMGIAIGIMLLGIVPILLGQAVSAKGHELFLKMIQGQTLILTWSLALLSFGLFISASSRRSISSLAVILGAVFCALVLLPALVGVLSASDVRYILLQYHPFVILDALQSSYGDGDHYVRDVAVRTVPLIYCTFAGMALYGTHVLLRRLEEPRRK